MDCRKATGILERIDPSEEIRTVKFGQRDVEKKCCKLVLSGGETFVVLEGAGEPLGKNHLGRKLTVTQFEDGETRIQLLD
jgi:hypothetical protein